MAATFIDTQTGLSRRLFPNATAREQAAIYSPEARNRWEVMLLYYQRMPQALLLQWQTVELTTPVEVLLSRPGARLL